MIKTTYESPRLVAVEKKIKGRASTTWRRTYETDSVSPHYFEMGRFALAGLALAESLGPARIRRG